MLQSKLFYSFLDYWCHLIRITKYTFIQSYSQARQNKDKDDSIASPIEFRQNPISESNSKAPLRASDRVGTKIYDIYIQYSHPRKELRF